MILLDGLILSNWNERLKMIDDKRGGLLLTEYEIDALDCYFPGVGVRWKGGAIVQIPACVFRLTVTEGDETILDLAGCKFIEPEAASIIFDDEMIQVFFESRDGVIKTWDCLNLELQEKVRYGVLP